MLILGSLYTFEMLCKRKWESDNTSAWLLTVKLIHKKRKQIFISEMCTSDWNVIYIDIC